MSAMGRFPFALAVVFFYFCATGTDAQDVVCSDVGNKLIKIELASTYYSLCACEFDLNWYFYDFDLLGVEFLAGLSTPSKECCESASVVNWAIDEARSNNGDYDAARSSITTTLGFDPFVCGNSVCESTSPCGVAWTSWPGAVNFDDKSLSGYISTKQK